MGPGRYRERLIPGIGTWLLAAGCVAMLSIAYGAALGAAAGWLCAAVAGAAAVGIILATAPVITVDDAGLGVARARLPWHAVAGISSLDASETVTARDTDARAFLALRPLISRTSVRIDIDDPQDPHPYWLVTSRHPDRFISSLRSGTAARPPSDPPMDRSPQ